MARAAEANTFALDAQAAEIADARPSSSQALTRELRDRIGALGGAVVEPVGQIVAAGGRPFAVRELGVAHAGRARADEHTDAARAVLRARRADRVEKPILRERALRQTIVAAVEARERARQRDGLESRDRAYPAGQRGVLEALFGEAGALGAQRADVRVAARAHRARHGVGTNREGFHRVLKSKPRSQRS